MRSLRIDAQSVFLNVPFDASYQPVFLGLISGLVAMGLKPRSVIEIPEKGEGRMARLYDLLSSCGASIHDLSRVNTPVRFNMPFELGIAYALHQLMHPRHSFIILESKSHRLLKTLSDLKMVDPKIHRGSGRQALRCIYDSFSSKTETDSTARGLCIYKHLRRKLDHYRDGQKTIFNRLSFNNVIKDAIAINQVLRQESLFD